MNSREPQRPATGRLPSWIKRHWAALAVLGIVAAAVAINRFNGRVWFCQCGQLRFVIASASSEHTSQHLLDPYSLSHVQHGFVLFWFLYWLAPGFSWQSRQVISTAIEATWEVIENTPFVINRYREATAALGYTGDSVVNSLGDVLACVVGFAIAGKIGLRWTIVVFVVIEAAMVVTIRDSLLLNVLMLFWPLEAVKQWQMAE
jgi:hypothetical protein